MRAVSHPARWRVLQELWAGRSLTGTQAAELVGLTPSAMSYHLRHLADLGLVERADSADGRERPWRASTDGVRMTAQPDAVLGGTMMQNLQADVGRLLATPPAQEGEDRPWQASFTHRTLRLDRERAKALHREIAAVIDRYAEGAEDAQEPGADTPEHQVFWIQGVTG
jgi:DNA-binding transcriptional ArsR family regulator